MMTVNIFNVLYVFHDDCKNYARILKSLLVLVITDPPVETSTDQ